MMRLVYGCNERDVQNIFYGAEQRVIQISDETDLLLASGTERSITRVTFDERLEQHRKLKIKDLCALQEVCLWELHIRGAWPIRL